jgi:DNA polymerase-3 subunit epsilon
MSNENTIREIVLDTETTGLDPKTGDRVVEIGCVELVNYVPTGNHFHVYLDPERDVPQEAFRVHGLSKAFLTGKPKFSQIIQELLAFIGQSPLIIHNAEFDVKFLNSELAKCGHGPLMMDRVIDTLAIARRKHPGASNSLDALCTRYKVDNIRRTKHGALLDAEILADIYVELSGGRQTVFPLIEVQRRAINPPAFSVPSSRHHAIDVAISKADLVAHAKLVKEMGDKAFWCNFHLLKLQERSDGSA